MSSDVCAAGTAKEVLCLTWNFGNASKCKSCLQIKSSQILLSVNMLGEMT